MKDSLLVFDYQISCTLLHKTSLICLNIFRDNTIIVYVITFSNKKLNKLCDLMRNSFELNTYLFFWDERFISGSNCPGVFCKKGVLRHFANFIGKHLCHSLVFNKVAGLGLQLYLKRDPGTGVFLWILQNFQEHLLRISKNTSGGCFCISTLLCSRKILWNRIFYWYTLFWKVLWEFTLKLEIYLFVFNVICSF